MRICVTGHRFWTNPEEEKKGLFSSLETFISTLSGHISFVHGCAYGVDINFGEFARIRGIDLHLYFPFNRITQIVRSPKIYDPLFTRELNKQYKIAKKVVYVNKTFSTYGYQKRNIELVNNCDVLCTYYTRNRSGSGNCYRYALSKGKLVFNLRKPKQLVIVKKN